MAQAIISKHWYQSRVLWFNVATGLAMLGSGLEGLGLIPDKYLLLLSVAGNIILRFVTGQPIAGSPAAINSGAALPPTPPVPTNQSPIG